MNEPNFSDVIPYILAYSVAFLICIAITRAIFSISKFLKYQKANLFLLGKIAESNGVPKSDVIDAIKITSDIPYGNAHFDKECLMYLYNKEDIDNTENKAI